MKISYKKLWKLLIDRNMRKMDLQQLAGISSTSVAKLAKGENVQTDILIKICRVLECDTSDIMEIEPNDVAAKKSLKKQRKKSPNRTNMNRRINLCPSKTKSNKA